MRGAKTTYGTQADLVFFESEQPDFVPTPNGPVLLINEVRRGGMGVVYRAIDWDDNLIALKFSAGRNPEDSDKFRIRHDLEIRAMDQIKRVGVPCFADYLFRGDHVVKKDTIASDKDEYVQFPYFAMEYIDGQDYDLTEISYIPPEEVVEMGYQILKGLAKLHDHGRVHRDIKPANIRRDWRGRVVLLDFGISKNKDPEFLRLTAQQTGEDDLPFIGTAVYSAPEQIFNEGGTDPRSDIYQLGMTMYELFTGRSPPLKAMTKTALFAKIAKHILPPPTENLSARYKRATKTDQRALLEMVGPLVQKMISKKRRDRYQCAEEALDAWSPFRPPEREFMHQADFYEIFDDASNASLPNKAFNDLMMQRYGPLFVASPGFLQRLPSILPGDRVTLDDDIRIQKNKADTWILGRNDRSDYAFRDPSVSKQHAEITRKDDLLAVTDLGSSNGTWVMNTRDPDVQIDDFQEQHRVKPGETKHLLSGGWIRLGGIMRRIFSYDRVRDVLTRMPMGEDPNSETRAIDSELLRQKLEERRRRD